MVGIRGAGVDSIYQQRPADFLVVPGFRHPRRQLVFLSASDEGLGAVGRINLFTKTRCDKSAPLRPSAQLTCLLFDDECFEPSAVRAIGWFHTARSPSLRSRMSE
jgi:hypothetical protein